jgi:hypothetical protein
MVPNSRRASRRLVALSLFAGTLLFAAERVQAQPTVAAPYTGIYTLAAFPGTPPERRDST